MSYESCVLVQYNYQFPNRAFLKIDVSAVLNRVKAIKVRTVQALSWIEVEPHLSTYP